MGFIGAMEKERTALKVEVMHLNCMFGIEAKILHSSMHKMSAPEFKRKYAVYAAKRDAYKKRIEECIKTIEALDFIIDDYKKALV